MFIFERQGGEQRRGRECIHLNIGPLHNSHGWSQPKSRSLEFRVRHRGPNVWGHFPLSPTDVDGKNMQDLNQHPDTRVGRRASQELGYPIPREISYMLTPSPDAQQPETASGSAPGWQGLKCLSPYTHCLQGYSLDCSQNPGTVLWDTCPPLAHMPWERTRRPDHTSHTWKPQLSPSPSMPAGRDLDTVSVT